MTVYKKLQEARILLQNTKLSKSGKNKFAGYEYFELGDFLPAIQKICNDVGLCGVVSFNKEDAYLVIHNTEGDDFVTFTSPMSSAALKGCHDVQNLGAVQTYLRRYLWTNAFEIVEHDALDSSPGAEPKADASVMADHLLAIQDAASMEDLKNVYIAAYAACDGDKGWQKKVMEAKEKRKGELK